ncbi:MAG: DUF2076 domain-containing protein [Janthinobacterium lividum]
MTPQEQEMIDGLISRIRNTQVTNKDTAAEQRLQQGLAGFPDAVYVLAQTVLVQQYGLQQAQAQMSDLKQQIQALQDQQQQAAQSKSSDTGGGFLSHIFGGGSSSAPSQPAQTPSYQPVNNAGYGTQIYPGGGYPPPPPSYPPQNYPAPSGGGFGLGGGGFLQGALRTAAGVAAGEMAFQGMESLFHGVEHGGRDSGSGFAGMGGGGETVVNNYYDDDKGEGDRGGDRRDDNSFYNPSDDASRSDSGSQFADSGSDTGNFDDSGSDNFDNSDSGDTGSGF